MIRYTIHVPDNLNDGTPAPELLDAALGGAARLGGGATATPGIGVWESPSGFLYREPIHLVHVDMDRARDWEVRRLAAKLAADGAQESVYVTRADGASLSRWLVESTDMEVAA